MGTYLYRAIDLSPLSIGIANIHQLPTVGGVAQLARPLGLGSNATRSPEANSARGEPLPRVGLEQTCFANQNR